MRNRLSDRYQEYNRHRARFGCTRLIQLSVVIVLGLTACQALPAGLQPAPERAAAADPSMASDGDHESPVQQEATATEIFSAQFETEVHPQPTGVPLVDGPPDGQSPEGEVLAADPLKFVFPTPGPVPVSAWRPPLYEVPWALTPFDHFYFARPIGADEVNWPLADYRYGGKFFADTIHTGVDIPAPEGTTVLAAAAGKVIQAGYGVYSGMDDPDDPYGLAVVIRHDFGYQGNALYTVYGHLSQIDVARGQHLALGDPLGLVGQTGFTTGPHLHFEVRIGENRFFYTRNPELWIAPPLGWGVLAGRVMDNRKRLYPGQTVYIHSHSTGQTWQVISYGSEAVRSDPYYQENLVIGDLPAGNYDIRISYLGVLYQQAITIKPGVVNYFTFEGRLGFGDSLPPTPAAEYTPPLAP